MFKIELIINYPWKGCLNTSNPGRVIGTRRGHKHVITHVVSEQWLRNVKMTTHVVNESLAMNEPRVEVSFRLI